MAGFCHRGKLHFHPRGSHFIDETFAITAAGKADAWQPFASALAPLFAG